jgi:hypothetical protein
MFEVPKDLNGSLALYVGLDSMPRSLLWGTNCWGSEGAQHLLGKRLDQYSVRRAMVTRKIEEKISWGLFMVGL